MPALNSYRIFPLGDSALTLDFGNFLDENVNERVIALFDSLKEDPLPGVKDLVPAYSSLTVFFTFDWNKGSSLRYNRQQVTAQLEKRLQSIPALTEKPYRTLRIPICYDREFGLDLEEVSARNNITVEEIIELHLAHTYQVYMLGFLPGFAYMGRIDPRLEMPRKAQPRQRVEPGSVGIVGLQTGIYPMTCPGGWQLIGRTPLRLFDPNATDSSICLFHPGDHVQFYSIDRNEFESYKGGIAG